EGQVADARRPGRERQDPARAPAGGRRDRTVPGRSLLRLADPGARLGARRAAHRANPRPGRAAWRNRARDTDRAPARAEGFAFVRQLRARRPRGDCSLGVAVRGAWTEVAGNVPHAAPPPWRASLSRSSACRPRLAHALRRTGTGGGGGF